MTTRVDEADPSVPTDDDGTVATGGRSFADFRFVAILGVIGLSVTTVTTFVLAGMKTATLIGKLFSAKRNDDLLVVKVLEVVDTHLLGVVQLIVVVGLYELFIADLRLPSWLEARTLDDLKKPIVDVLVVFVAIKGIERFLVADEPIDGLVSIGAAALLIAALSLFRSLSARSKR